MRKCKWEYFEYIIGDIISRIYDGTFTSVIDIERWYNVILTNEQIATINKIIEEGE